MDVGAGAAVPADRVVGDTGVVGIRSAGSRGLDSHPAP